MNIVETIEYRGHDINIYYDDSGENPRTDWDNADVMFFQHRRYTLGDKDAEDPFEDINEVDLGEYWIAEDTIDFVRNMLGKWCDVIAAEDPLRIGGDYRRAEAAYRWISGQEGEFDDERTVQRLRYDIAICLPVMMYDHSGITIWHGSQNPAQDSAGWDSGLIGFHYITKDAVEKEWNGDLEAAQRYMDATLKTYDSYLHGDVYSYVVDDDGDSCGGFIGSDYEESGLLEYARNAIDCLVEAEDKAKDILMMECD